MIVAYCIFHNDGVVKGILDKPNQDTGTTIVDLYEADGEIATFSTLAEAEQWLISRKVEE